MKVLVTGGAGYIGSHTCVELLKQGHDLMVLDDLSNSHPTALKRVEEIASKSVRFIEGSILDASLLQRTFQTTKFDMVVHFAAFKAVGESAAKPLDYYHNNVSGTTQLLRAMQQNECKKLVYSSSCTVYGQSEVQPIDESQPTAAAESPYGWTKLMTEQIMRDLVNSDPDWDIALLRYFNPIGAHPSGKIGEDPNDIPNNLLPFITQVAIGKLPMLRVFGNDYPTPDGTCIRDYIHVVDLAEAHCKAVTYLSEPRGLVSFNLGTGTGTSVLEVIGAFERATGVKIEYQIAPRREGDITLAYANPAKAAAELNWQSQRTVQQACSDSWRWQQDNPNGYRC